MPPTTSATVCCGLVRTALKAASTCIASSRVGNRISACAAFRSCAFCSISTIGIKKAKRLAGSGLGRRQHIAAFESRRNAAGLYRRRGYKIVCVEPRHQRRLKD